MLVVALLVFPATWLANRVFTQRVIEPASRVRAAVSDVTAVVHESREVKEWFYPDFAKVIGVIDPPEIFVEFLDTPDRVVIEVTPTKAITYDGDKMAEATDKFLASRQG